MPATSDVYFVSGKSKPRGVAGFIAACVNENRPCKLRAIGANAVNQTVKALAIARGYVSPNNINLTFVPVFDVGDVEGEERTAILFLLVIQRGE